MTKKQIAINALLETYNKLYEINKGNVEWGIVGNIQKIQKHPNQWTIKIINKYNNNLQKYLENRI